MHKLSKRQIREGYLVLLTTSDFDKYSANEVIRQVKTFFGTESLSHTFYDNRRNILSKGTERYLKDKGKCYVGLSADYTEHDMLALIGQPIHELRYHKHKEIVRLDYIMREDICPEDLMACDINTEFEEGLI